MVVLKRMWLLVIVFISHLSVAQDLALYQSDFPPEEFLERRSKIFEQIGDQDIALLQSAPSVKGFSVFRQSNQFYYLCGVEVPHAYLLLDGRNRRTTLFLPHRDESRERGEGKRLSAEDADLVKKLTGVEGVMGVEMLSKHLSRRLIRQPFPVLFTPFSPAEGRVGSRDEILSGQARAFSDPWDSSKSREGQFLKLVRSRFPQFEIRDLSPILDEMRIIKSSREIALIRRASQLAGLGLMEAMRSTEPGVMEYQLDAAARYIFQIHGARDQGYSSITAGGTNAWMGHYFHNQSVLKDGDLVLMDYAPDYHYYTSDVARMWPVNGVFTPAQRELCGFILGYYRELIERIRPGVTPDQVMDETAAAMRAIFERTNFSKESYRRAAEEALTFRGHLSHPVGMAVHDVGDYKSKVLQPGMVFSIDPMIWVPEEKQYVRIEDVVVVTENGVENFTDFVPSQLDEIEKVMREEGILQRRPPYTLPEELTKVDLNRRPRRPETLC